MLFSIERLHLALQSAGGEVALVRGVSLEVGAGECVALVGESGSGKTLTALSVLRLLPPRICVTSGRVLLEERDLLRAPPAELRRTRGARIAMIFQEAMSALNPLMPVGEQIAEPLRIHRGWSRRAALGRATELLRRVGIADAGRRSRQYPFEFSGGMCQRVMIAMALACEPALLIADEPTTALDVTIQAQIVELLRELRRETRLALLLITHDLGLAAALADRVYVMYAGCVVEQGSAGALLSAPAHPYTRALLACVPRLDAAPGRRAAIGGSPPDPVHPPGGCRFHPRCERAGDEQRCRSTEPMLEATGAGGAAACWKPGYPRGG